MITRISEIELSSVCNLRCHYCPSPTMKREKGFMSEEVFARCLYWMKELGQKEINLHHIGESTLHPRFIEYVDRVTDIIPTVGLSTNGVSVTREMIRGLKAAGLNNLTLSVHRPEVVQKVAEMCVDEDLHFDWGSGPLSAPHNWAGQAKAQIRNSSWAKTFECQFLIDQACVVLSDGRLATCCIDAEGVVDIGTIFDDLRQINLRPFSLCTTCHHQIPEGLFPGWREEVAREHVPSHAAR